MNKKLVKEPSSSAHRRTPAGRGRENGGTRRHDARMDPLVERWFAGVKDRFSPTRSSTIPMLQSAQVALGYLPREAMHAIARYLGVAPAVIEGVASFYAQFRFDPPGRNRVTVCSGTACYVRGSGKLMDDIRADLKISPGATSADGAVTLESVSCFGACALAPVVVLNDQVLRQQTADSLKKLINGLSSAPSRRRSSSAGKKAAARGARR